MRYLSLDNAFAVSGYAIWEDNTLITYGLIKTNSTDDDGKRLLDIELELCKLWDNYRFDKIFFEDCQSQSNKNIQTYSKLSMVKGIILYWCAHFNKTYNIYSPSSWRSILKKEYKIKFGRNRTEQKKKAQELIKQIYNKDVKEDEADAICIGLAGIIDERKSKSAF